MLLRVRTRGEFRILIGELGHPTVVVIKDKKRGEIASNLRFYNRIDFLSRLMKLKLVLHVRLLSAVALNLRNCFYQRSSFNVSSQNKRPLRFHGLL